MRTWSRAVPLLLVGILAVGTQAAGTAAGPTQNRASASYPSSSEAREQPFGSPASNDLVAPVVASISVPVQVAAGASVTVQWRLTDASGVDFTTAWIRGPSGTVVPQCGGNSAPRISGTPQDGTYSQTCQISASAPAGVYSVSIYAADVIGNLSEQPQATFQLTGGAAPSPSPTPTPTASPSPSPSPTPTASPSPTPAPSDPEIPGEDEAAFSIEAWKLRDGKYRILVTTLEPTTEFRVVAQATGSSSRIVWRGLRSDEDGEFVFRTSRNLAGFRLRLVVDGMTTARFLISR